MARRRPPPTRRTPQEKLIAGAVGGIVGAMMSTRGGRRGLVVLVVLGLLLFGAYWLWENHLRRRHPVGPTVRLATWNLRKFSDRPETDVAAIARVIKANQFDLVAIQEVMGQGEMVDRLVRELGRPWTATQLSERTPGDPLGERFIFVYHGDHVQQLGPARQISLSGAEVFARRPYQCSFRAGQFDFTLVNVHLTYTDRDRRREEARVLSRFVPELVAKSEEKDVIVLGDFNEQGKGNMHYFEEQGYKSLNLEPSNLGGTETYDTLVIEPKLTKEWSGAAAAVEFDESEYGNNDEAAGRAVSDHRPVYADFVTNLPDDD